MKKLFLIPVFLLSFVSISFASWPWESNYYECVSEGITDGGNIVPVQQMCKAKYPPKKLPDTECGLLTGRAYVSGVIRTHLIANIYNGSSMWEIHEIVVEIAEEGGRTSRYALNIKAIPPLSTYESRTEILPYAKKLDGWRIINAKGYKK